MNKTNNQAASAGKTPYRKTFIVTLILAILAASLIIQMVFITGENNRLIESAAIRDTLAEQNIKPQTEIATTALPKPDRQKSVTVSAPPENSGSQKNTQTVRINLKELSQQTATVPVQNSLKKQTNHDFRAERLRRAEKILTGF